MKFLNITWLRVLGRQLPVESQICFKSRFKIFSDKEHCLLKHKGQFVIVLNIINNEIITVESEMF